MKGTSHTRYVPKRDEHYNVVDIRTVDKYCRLACRYMKKLSQRFDINCLIDVGSLADSSSFNIPHCVLRDRNVLIMDPLIFQITLLACSASLSYPLNAQFL